MAQVELGEFRLICSQCGWQIASHQPHAPTIRLVRDERYNTRHVQAISSAGILARCELDMETPSSVTEDGVKKYR